MGRRRASPEVVAAVVNGAVTLLLPVIVVAIQRIVQRYDRYDYSTTVYPSGWSPLLAAMEMFVTSAVVMSPFALLAAWRTWAHARRWQTGDHGWRGVAEAGACGLAVALLVLSPGIISKPGEALPYVLAYGGLGLMVGLTVGLLLLVTASVVLKLTEHRMHD